MKNWIQAFRLRTLPLAFSGWLVGISIAHSQGEIRWDIALLTLLTAFLLQILSNLANDYGDATSGVDQHRKGELRMVQAGLISSAAMKRAMVIAAFLSLILGVILLYFSFPQDWFSALIFFALGLVGIAAAVKYTVGRNPYGYAGFGDLFVFIFFGLVLVFGTYYLQVQSLDWLVLLPASSLGFFSVGVLNVNNIRDIESDKASGKNSIPVRVGKKAAEGYHAGLLIGAVVASLVFVVTQDYFWAHFLFLLVVIPLGKNVRAVFSLKGDQLDPYLKQMAISTLLFSVLFATGQFGSSFFG